MTEDDITKLSSVINDRELILLQNGKRIMGPPTDLACLPLQAPSLLSLDNRLGA